MTGSRSWEADINTSRSAALARIIKGLPSIWATRREANRLLPTLPEYQWPLELPDAATLYSWIEQLCVNPHRRPGSAYGLAGEKWVAAKLRELGAEDVTLDPVPVHRWEAHRWELRCGALSIPAFYVPHTRPTGPEGVEAPLAYVATGRPRDFAAVELTGKIAVAEVTFPRMPTGLLMRALRATFGLSDPDGDITLGTSQYLNFARQNFVGGTDASSAPTTDVYWESVRRGAVGVCLILRDQPSTSNSHYGPYDGISKPVPGLWIGKGDAPQLRRLAREGATAKLLLEATESEGQMHNVWGVLPGYTEEVILVTSHHDSPFLGAVEDASGVAQVLAQAAAWAHVPREKRPCTLVFVLSAGHFHGSAGAHAFARTHPELMKRARVLLTLEHLAAKEVTEHLGNYRETGKLAFSVMFTSADPGIVAPLLKAMRREPPRRTASIPSDLLAPVPTSDACGYVLESGVPVISWIGCPSYLLDEHDTLDKIDRNELAPVSRTVLEIVKAFMARPS